MSSRPQLKGCRGIDTMIRDVAWYSSVQVQSFNNQNHSEARKRAESVFRKPQALSSVIERI